MATDVTHIMRIANSPDGTTFFAAKRFAIQFDNGYPQMLGVTKMGMVYKKWEKQGNKVYSVINNDVPDLMQQYFAQEELTILDFPQDLIVGFTERELTKRWYDAFMLYLEGIKRLVNEDMEYVKQIPNKCYILQQCMNEFPEDYV